MGNTTLEAVSADACLLQDVTGQIYELELRRSQNRHDLNALLGLAPDVKLQILAGTHVHFRRHRRARAKLHES